ncbi:MAG: UDP-N-acetylglucosamine 4,6-dehydratase (inverting) [Bacteroidales bacterium]|nr:UDP-N-acetylglucosamine 4,6-dehydratase (inverting) [Bacteroidales bacterium]
MKPSENFSLNGKSVLVTGGTGSFGKKFVETVLQRWPQIKRLVIYSRDELKQYEMAQLYPKSKYDGIRFFIGDIRDAERFKRACEGIEIIVHAAALKQVPAAEYNPMEFIKTNILGAENVINAALDTGVKQVVALSTDKAASPINLYGATKLCSDKLFISANNIKGRRDIHFSVVRYGNVMGSRGSVIPFFIEHRKHGFLPITHPEMTRFNITLDEGVDLVLFAIEKSIGSEIFVPKIPSYKILDVAEAIAPYAEKKIVGIRPGEKIHEEMITEHDSISTIDGGNYYIILPVLPEKELDKFIEHHRGKIVAKGFKYNSGTNTHWLSVEEIRKLIKQHVDPNFSVE